MRLGGQWHRWHSIQPCTVQCISPKHDCTCMELNFSSNPGSVPTTRFELHCIWNDISLQPCIWLTSMTCFSSAWLKSDCAFPLDLWTAEDTSFANLNDYFLHSSFNVMMIVFLSRFHMKLCISSLQTCLVVSSIWGTCVCTTSWAPIVPLILFEHHLTCLHTYNIHQAFSGL